MMKVGENHTKEHTEQLINFVNKMNKINIYFLFVIFFIITGISGCERRTSKISKCVINLHTIQIIKAEWASEFNQPSNAIPTWEDLKPYFPSEWSNTIPVCPISPKNGTYIINRVDQAPKCTVCGDGYGEF